MTISTLVGLGTEPQLKLHINTGFNVGLTKEKIVGALSTASPTSDSPGAQRPDASQRGHGRAGPDPGNQRGVEGWT